MYIRDNETKVDMLYYEATANTIVDLIIDESDEPMSIGIHGDWGAGKSSILMMIEDKLTNKGDNFFHIRFNAWRYQGFDDVKSSLMEFIILQLMERNEQDETFVAKCKKLLNRVDKMKLFKKSVGLLVPFITGIPNVDTIVDVKAILTKLPEIIRGGATPEKLISGVEEALDLLKPEETTNLPQEMNEFITEFSSIIEEAKFKKFVVLIDDLDRCLPETSVETMEAIRLFLFVPKSVFVIAADEKMIEYAVNRHFPELPGSAVETYSSRYLEKIIQIPFRLPSLGYTETQIYIALLLIERSMIDQGQFENIIKISRGLLKQPWANQWLTVDNVKVAFGPSTEVPQNVCDAINFSDTIYKIIADCTKGNPRQIKRFLNSMQLKEKIANERGIQDINQGVLAKIMIAEGFFKKLYAAITQDLYLAPNGKSELINAIEISDSEQIMLTNIKKKTDTDLEPNVSKWGFIDPKLSDVDLRPYIFLTNNQGFTIGSQLGSLNILVQKLINGKDLVLASEQLKKEMLSLTGEEAEKVYDALMKHYNSSNLREDPKGLFHFVKVCNKFQNPLISYLDTVKPTDVGMWVINLQTLTKVDKERLSLLFGKWQAQDDNTQLKRVIQNFVVKKVE